MQDGMFAGTQFSPPTGSISVGATDEAFGVMSAACEIVCEMIFVNAVMAVVKSTEPNGTAEAN